MSEPVKEESTSAAVLLPIMAAIFGVYIVMGMAMPVLPLYVHQGLGFNPFVVGLVSGAQFAAAMFSRLWAGQHADTKGAKRALLTGVLVAAGSGLVYVLSFYFASHPKASVGILLLGRAVLGLGESFVITGALTVGLTLLGPNNTGKVMSWIGTALYMGFAIGAPAGTTIYGGYGFQAVAFATLLIPLAGLPLLSLVRRGPLSQRKRTAGLTKVAGAVWIPGVGVALAGVGFGAISTFIVLLYAARGWTPSWLPFTALSIAFIGGRAVFGHLPDKLGGAQVACGCIVVEAVGQALIWRAHTSWVALPGVVLTGLGYSLVYPGFGVEAIHRAPRPKAVASRWDPTRPSRSIARNHGTCSRASRRLGRVERRFSCEQCGCTLCGRGRLTADVHACAAFGSTWCRESPGGRGQCHGDLLRPDAWVRKREVRFR